MLFLKVLSSFFAKHGHSFKLENTKLSSSLYNVTYALLFLFYLSFFSFNYILMQMSGNGVARQNNVSVSALVNETLFHAVTLFIFIYLFTF